jgi:acyl-lipid omega-6 desaturase (Delta-12 desaturase)
MARTPALLEKAEPSDPSPTRGQANACDRQCQTRRLRTTTRARRWVQVLAAYRDPSRLRSLLELGSTLVPFVGLWALAWWSLSISPWLATIAVLNGGLLVRLFAIQHDCGHGAFFPDRRANDAAGRALGVLTLTPYAVWKRTHSIHHSTAGNLDRRDLGDIETLTVRTYRE